MNGNALSGSVNMHRNYSNCNYSNCNYSNCTVQLVHKQLSLSLLPFYKTTMFEASMNVS